MAETKKLLRKDIPALESAPQSHLSAYRVFYGSSLRSSSVHPVCVQSPGALTAGLVFLQSTSAGEWGATSGEFVDVCFRFFGIRARCCHVQSHDILCRRHSFRSVLLSRKLPATFLCSVTSSLADGRIRNFGSDVDLSDRAI